MKKIAVYAGTFDPLTSGHTDILRRALKVFDKVIVGIGVNSKKTPMFTAIEREHFIKMSFPQEVNTGVLDVKFFGGLLVDFANENKAQSIVRGLRNGTDFEYEFQLAHINTRMKPEIEHVYFMASEEDHFVSSSVVKEIHSLGGDVSSMVPLIVLEALNNKK